MIKRITAADLEREVRVDTSIQFMGVGGLTGRITGSEYPYQVATIFFPALGRDVEIRLDYLTFTQEANHAR